MSLEVGGLDGIISDLKKLSGDVDDIADEMLDAAGEVMTEAWKEEITRRGFIDSGQMRKSVKSKKNKKYRRVDTYPMGDAEYKSAKSSWKTSNAAKAFVLHHGKKGHQKATYFVNDVRENGGVKAQAAMQQVLNNKLKKKGL